MKIYQDATKGTLRWGKFCSFMSTAILICIIGLGLIAFIINILVGINFPSDAETLCSNSFKNVIIFTVICDILFIALMIIECLYFTDMGSYNYSADTVAIFYHKEKHTLSIFSAACNLVLPPNYSVIGLSSVYDESHSVNYEQNSAATFHVHFRLSFNIIPDKLTDLGRDVLRQCAEEEDVYAVLDERLVEGWLMDKGILKPASYSYDVDLDALLKNPFGFQNVELSNFNIYALNKKNAPYEKQKS